MGNSLGSSRQLTPTLERALARSPVVILSGARQVGKSTLVQSFSGAREREYRTLDHLPTLARAQQAPEALVAEHPRLTLDEVQRAPELMLAVKYVVDREKRAGQFLLTGSANLLLTRTSGESLAGRAQYLTLRPMTAREADRRALPGGWDALLDARDAAEALASSSEPDEIDWREQALRGGFPPAALAASSNERTQWLEDYASTYLRRDLRELARVDDLAGFSRLMQLAALRSGGLLNQTDLARDAALSRTTTQRWLSLLEATYLVTLVPPFFESRSKRLVSAPKLYPGDTGLALHLAGIANVAALARLPRPGLWLEGLVLNDLLAWIDTRSPKPALYHYRTATGQEIDFVLESGPRRLPIEVKSSPAVRPDDGRVIERFCAEHGDRAPFGVVLYAGRERMRLTTRSIAIPLGAVI
jgi:hypothetical protein